MSKRAYVVYSEERRVDPYADAVRNAGIEPVLSKIGMNWDFDEVQGLLLTGGTDVSPEFYGEEPAPETDKDLDVPRDRVELAMIAEALARDLPVLAICRGMQILNIQAGGTLIQHLPTTPHHQRRTTNRSLVAHSVVIEPNTKLAAIAGTTAWQVNSRHHQAVGRLGENLRVSAVDSHDRTIEAIEKIDKRFVVAVQWHPEDQAPVNDEQRKLFTAFKDSL